MRVCSILMTAPKQSGARRPQREPVPFQMLLPLKLKNSVSGKNDKETASPCLGEMQLLFACLKKSDYEQNPCTKEIGNFQSCFDTHSKESALRKEQSLQGILVPGEKNLSHRQANVLMKRYPTF